MATKKSGAASRSAPKKKSKKTTKVVTPRTKRNAKAHVVRSKRAQGATGAREKTTAKSGKLARITVRQRADQYNPQVVEPKWQKRWEADQLYRAVIDPNKQKYYALTMLPYPSGDLHIGHWYAMTPSDARARWLKMRGYNVMFPIGFDAFGLPAENAAIQRRIHPKKWTYKNIANMRRQLRTMGAMWDWEREAVSADPEYYKWTQWFFKQLFKHGLAYKKMSPVDWCPNCQTTLAREQVWGEDRHCERCKTPVIKKNLEQWYFRTTKYAEELLRFEGIDWPAKVREMQTNWVGRSEGAQVKFTTGPGDVVEVFTTRPDTLWGATFMVLAPEHPLVEKLTTPDRQAEVDEYVFEATRQTDVDRESAEKEKTGVFIGAYAINPVNNAPIPIWIADYVLMTYGTGAIMGVPGHDERDFQFALKYGLPIWPVIEQPDGLTKSFALGGTMKDGFADALRAANIPFEARQGSLYITLPAERDINDYLHIAQRYVRPGKWNEIVGRYWLFVFGKEDGVESLEWTPETDQQILARCHELEPNVRDKHTVMEMLWAVEFYRDALYHDQYGKMINSGEFTGMPGDVAKKKVTEWLEEKGVGQGAVTYRLRDWLISRQRYWGAPIPIVYCPEHGMTPVPDEQLPVMLPDDVEWLPTGQSPLKLHPTWAHTTCPTCGKPALRDTDTMDTFMCSSWYHLRYLSPHYAEGPFDPAEYDYWMPVDTYTGGAEHATMHLIYTRFFHKALRDMGIAEGHEPMLQLRNQGQILGPDSQRMSKSRGNVIDPDAQVKTYGADTVRAYLMFAYQWSEGGPWSMKNIQGVVRWLNRVWAISQNPKSSKTPAVERRGQKPTLKEAEERNPAAEQGLRRITHQTIKRVSDDFEKFEFNTIVSALMEFTNALYKYRETQRGTPAWDEAIKTLLLLMAPVTPHIAEELWARRGQPYSIHQQAWPQWDPAIAAEDMVTIVVQVNGKVRDRFEAPATITEAEAKQKALATDGAKRHTDGKAPKAVVYVPGRLVNIVV